MNNFAYTDMEHVEIAPGSLEKIMEVSGGDMRRAVTFLQSCFQLSGGTTYPTPVTIDMVVDIGGEVSVLSSLCSWNSICIYME